MKNKIKLLASFSVIVLMIVILSVFINADNLKSPVITTSNSSNSVCVKWSKVNGADSYAVYKSSSSGTWTKIFQTNSTSYIDTNVTEGSKYSYKVTALKGAQSSSFSNTSNIVFIKPVKITEIKNISSNRAKIYWSKNNNCTGYRLYRKTVNGNWEIVKTNGNKNKTSAIDKNAKTGIKYIYVVKALYKTNETKYFSSKSNEKSNIYVNAPGKVSVKNSPKGIAISWTKVSASKIIVYRKITGVGSLAKIKTLNGTSTSYIDNTVSYGKRYSYAISVISTNGYESGKGKSSNLYTVNPNKKMVALTYDDGPYSPVTNKILDVLKKYNGRATFFVVGSRLDSYKDTLKREVNQGCQIGNHTYDHTTLTTISNDRIQTQLSSTINKIKNITGYTSTIIRAPGGSTNERVRATVKYPIINWSVDTRDWETRNASSTISNIKSNVSDGSIVLMHDLYVATGNASETIIPWLVNQGYQLVTVSEMMDAKGIQMKNGTVYYRA